MNKEKISKECKICKDIPIDILAHLPTATYVCKSCMNNEYNKKHTYQLDYFFLKDNKWKAGQI
mgnify:CR=1 FL=1|tara:strand:- start:356 stop:544 length:189 start_codon:yes stop_codon:yes gene_type:complete